MLIIEKCLQCIFYAFPIRNTKLLNKECPEFVALPNVRIPLNAPQSYASNLKLIRNKNMRQSFALLNCIVLFDLLIDNIQG